MNFFWKTRKGRATLFQIIVFGLLGLAFLWLWSNTQANIKKQNIASGFGFLSLEAGFEISESVLAFDAGMTYARALSMGLLNTVKVALVGNALAIILGVIVGVLCLGKNRLLAGVLRSGIEFLRNIPLLLQLFFWYTMFTDILPGVKSAKKIFGHVYLSNRGVNFPDINFFPFEISYPQLQGFNFQGGSHISPEYTALLLGLVLYTGAFMAEIVRSGILSVPRGQWEAARSLGLGFSQTMRHVILPQALRVIIPPLTSQVLNLTKNSSLAVAIGYPDFVGVANTSMNQTGQAVELVALIMAVYLVLSLLTSLFMNWYNQKMRIVER